MFGDVTKLLDRNFVVGFVLPAAMLLSCGDAILSWYGVEVRVVRLTTSGASPWFGVTVMVLLTWLTGLLLLSGNRLLIRLKEGYVWDRLPCTPMLAVQRFRFRRLASKLARMDEEKECCERTGRKYPRQARRLQLYVDQAQRYPEKESELLPTAFGNTIRAFEVYPRVLYGAESTELWDRLLAVVPKDYRELVDVSRSQVDFWVNLWATSLILLLECVVLWFVQGRWIAPWVLGVLLTGYLLSSLFSRKLAIVWGTRVKACFDVFLPDLRDKLGIPAPKTRADEYQLWDDFSNAVTFRYRDALPSLDEKERSAGEVGGRPGGAGGSSEESAGGRRLWIEGVFKESSKETP